MSLFVETVGEGLYYVASGLKSLATTTKDFAIESFTPQNFDIKARKEYIWYGIAIMITTIVLKVFVNISTKTTLILSGISLSLILLGETRISVFAVPTILGVGYAISYAVIFCLCKAEIVNLKWLL